MLGKLTRKLILPEKQREVTEGLMALKTATGKTARTYHAFPERKGFNYIS
jgi:hypothetical protein